MNAVVEPGDEQGAAVLRLTGEITSANAAEIGLSALAGLDGVESLRVDLTEVTYLSSAGLRVLVLLYRNAESTGTKVTLFGLSPRLRFIMRAAGFLELFTETKEAA
jgi:anti-sigma B factor antagonist